MCKLKKPSKEAILSLDREARVERISGFWPEFPDLVAARFEQLWSGSESNRTRSRVRHEAFQSMDYEGLPPPEYLPWEKELFETVFNECIAGLGVQLWSTGEWDAGFAEEVLSWSIPRVRVRTAYELSRTMRPDLPTPRERRSERLPLAAMEFESELNGWYMLGCYERQIVQDGPYLSGSYKVYTLVQGTVQGAIVPDFSDLIPFSKADSEAAWNDSAFSPLEWFPRDIRPLIGAGWFPGIVGESMLLVLEQRYTKLCKLRLGPWPGRLELRDESEKPAVRFLQWRVKPFGTENAPETYSLEGCAISARPDIVATIQDTFGTPLTSVTRLTENVLPHRKGRD